jgi:hypothetical protein
MTDGGGGVQPGQGEFNPRSSFVAHEVFGHGAGAVLVAPDVARDLRSAAEFASQEQRTVGGLLYGRDWVDDEGPYLVVDGFLEASPGESPSDHVPRDARDSFKLSAADLWLLRKDAARRYPAALEVGWWRSLPGPGEFGSRDFETQRELVGPGGAGLLVFGAGLDWGTAYLGPEGLVPGSARSFIPVPRPGPEPPQTPALTLVPGLPAGPEPEPDADLVLGPGPELDADLALEPEPEPVAAGAPGTPLGMRRQPVLTPPPQPTRPAVASPVGAGPREWPTRPPSAVRPRTPTDVKIVVGALILTAIVAAIMVGALVSSALVSVIVAVACLLVLSAFIWMSRL